jgi:hypothetical protein
MQTDKIAILFNPSAGMGKAQRKKSRMEELLKKRWSWRRFHI